MLEIAAVEQTIARAENNIRKLTNGAGTVSTCPAHGALAEGIVCLSEMMIPVYKQSSMQHISEQSEIKSKWFTARGAAAMFPATAIICTALVCYTIIKLYVR